jgi:hypothetical protein
MAQADAADRDNLDHVYESEKQEQLKSSKEGKAKWKQELASNSEASVWSPVLGLLRAACFG